MDLVGRSMVELREIAEELGIKNVAKLRKNELLDALLEYEHDKTKWDLEKVIDAEQFFQVSHQSMLYRLVCDNLINL